MSEYEPSDQRDVHNGKPGENWREKEERQQSGQIADTAKDGKARKTSSDDQAQAQMGYGNAQDDQAQMEQDAAQPGETSGDPATRARADAARPLSGD